MRYYELAYLISSKLNQTEIEDLQKKVISILRKEGGVLDEENPTLKRTLAYPIKKETEAFLVSLTFFLDPQKVTSVKKEIEKEGAILRYLIFQKKAPKETKSKLVLPKEKITKPKKVELEKLEEKLEEILGEKKDESK
ncbi:30S ribosomal protein S6 [Candidatus Parcubacteria bacterium]|nr:30S ribosomal protein S6 [Candidatus Parcubacteria bacterium]